MTRKLATHFLLTLSLCLCASAHATLIDNGDTTFDTDTGLEWLDLTLTQGESYDSILSGFGGYLADGYQLATGDQMCSLWSSFGDVLPGCGGQAQGSMAFDNVDALLALLGATFGSSTIGAYDAGTLGDGTVGIGCLHAGIVGCSSIALGDPIVPGWLSFGEIFSFGTATADFGHYLVRSAAVVPEPAILGLLAAGLFGLGLARRMRA